MLVVDASKRPTARRSFDIQPAHRHPRWAGFFCETEQHLTAAPIRVERGFRSMEEANMIKNTETTSFDNACSNG